MKRYFQKPIIYDLNSITFSSATAAYQVEGGAWEDGAVPRFIPLNLIFFSLQDAAPLFGIYMFVVPTPSKITTPAMMLVKGMQV